MEPERNLNTLVFAPGVASHSLQLILRDCTEQQAEFIAREIDTAIRSRVRRLRLEHKFEIVAG